MRPSKRARTSSRTSQSSSKRRPAVVGWREWVALPDLGVASIKAKLDSGARTSALHAFDVEIFSRRGTDWARFRIHTRQRKALPDVTAEAEVVEFREVKSSAGHVTRRPTIVTTVELLDERWPIELTLASRDTMGFRMLLGREAMRGLFLVDPGKSFCGGRPPRRARKAK